MTLTHTRCDWRHGVQEFIDDRTQEIVHRMSAYHFRDDFGGYQLSSSESGSTGNWLPIAVKTGGTVVPIIAPDIGGGMVRCRLDSTDEAQESGLTWGNERTLTLNRGLMIQFVLRVTVLPTLLAEVVFGLAGDKNAVADTAAHGIWFKLDGSGAVVAETDDATTNTDDISTGITLVASALHVFLIDCNDPTDIKFEIDGNPVATEQTFSANATPTLALQPYIHLAKSTGAGLGVIEIDKVDIWQNRS